MGRESKREKLRENANEREKERARERELQLKSEVYIHLGWSFSNTPQFWQVGYDIYFVHDTSHFYNNCLQTDNFTYNSLYHNSSGSEVYTAWKIPENYIMDSEASDRLIDII